VSRGGRPPYPSFYLAVLLHRLYLVINFVAIRQSRTSRAFRDRNSRAFKTRDSYRKILWM